MLHHFFASSLRLFWVQLILIFSLAVAVEGQSSCVPRPISIPIRNVSVSNSDNNALVRGIAIDIGEPPQSFAFLPDTTNNSFVYPNNNFCPNIYPINYQECVTIRGGEYIAASSNTHGASTSDGSVADSKYKWDTKALKDFWRLSDQVSLQEYTFEVPSSDSGNQLYLPQALLGLGRNSTLLQALRDKGLIASRTWSYYWGYDGDNTGKTNGSLVLGGYDQDKVLGTTNYTAKLNYTGCDWGTQVEISDLKLEFLNSTSQTLFGDSGTDLQPPLPLYACINTGKATMFDLPFNNYMENFVDYTNFSSFVDNGLGNGSVRSTGLNWWNLKYLPGEKPYEGGISVHVKGGLSIKVDNEQLVVPHVYMDNRTSHWQQDMESFDLLINSLAIGQPTNQITLGRYFMTNMYIMVNLDVGEFTIWQANTDSNHETLVAVDDVGNVVENLPFCPTDSATSRPNPQATTSPSGPMTTGSIVGTSIGCAAAVGMFATGFWWFMRRRKQRKEPAVNGTTPEAAYQASWATPPPPFVNDPNKNNGSMGDRNTMLSTASFLDANFPSGTSNPSELSSNTPTYNPHHELQG